ncbi:hypothetical protein JCM15765_27890 [Paradesulfitobacterium aromaticivorans]
MLGLLGKTVSLMENLGFLWLVYSGFELQLWEQLQEEKSFSTLMAENPDWDPILLNHWLFQATIQDLIVCDNGTYHLSKFGKAIRRYQDYGLEAMYKEFAQYWGSCFTQLPELITHRSERLDMENEMKDDLISRASQSSEFFVWPVLRAKCEKENWGKILDVGCGEGVYLKNLLSSFPELTAMGLEINPNTAKRAQQGVERFQGRLQILCADIFDFEEVSSFDCCLLNNTIYYFVGEKRLELLQQIKKLLHPGGQIGILTALRGMTSSIPFFSTHIPQNLMSFFLACHQGFEGLPSEPEISELLEEAGFEGIEVIPLPFKVSHYFFARKPFFQRKRGDS